jgi:hypothetical protein
MDHGAWEPGAWEERCSRTNVTLLEYLNEQDPTVASVTTAQDLKNLLESTALTSTSGATSSPPLRVYIVEDLSPKVIELLGSRFAIDPHFFQEQLGDIDSPIPPVPSAGSKHRQWLSLRHVRVRKCYWYPAGLYSWNVRRKFQELHRTDFNIRIGTIETKTTIWLSKDKRCHDAFIGVVLVDPTVNPGFPHWNDRANWLLLCQVIKMDLLYIKQDL